MRILLAHNSLYYPSWGGGDKSNRYLMEALAARGHEVLVVSRTEKFGPEGHQRLLQDLEERGVQPEPTGAAVTFRLNGVLVHALTQDPNLRGFFTAHLRDFDPDVIIASTDDPGQLLIDIARRSPRARLVYLVRATIAVPFGPDSSMLSAAKTEALRDFDAVVGVSEHVAAYARQYGGLDAIHLPISLMDRVEPPNLASFDNPYVVMVNPCAVKGIAIFLDLAERMPHLQFAGVPMWGTTAVDLAAMRRLPNVTVIKAVDDIDKLFAQARVALVPSVWAEARSRVVVEAMLRGVPVIASDAGGLREAKLGVPYLLPVNPVRHYRPTLDENMVPVAEVPPQDIAPWIAALDRLTSDRRHWEEIASQSRAAALNYARTLTAEPFEQLLFELSNRPKKARAAAEPAPHGVALSDDKRKLMALRLKQRLAEKARLSWFPTAAAVKRGELRLFCFPPAGGGTLLYRAWALPGVSVLPASLPGRETRLDEPPFEDMSALVAALAFVIRPLLDAPYALFGHSMGAGIAFELAKALRRAGARMPSVLVVSGARAPQLRRKHSQPEPSEEELLDELRKSGTPADVLEHPDARRLAMPALAADIRLYRNYVAQPEPPLNLPIVAYGGSSDDSVPAESLEGWRAQTTASFIRREFPGDHFYLQSQTSSVLDALARDLQAGVTGAS